jgi:benzoylformate decarboxylase
VWQNTFSSRAGFPQDHPLFAGHLPWGRGELLETLAPHDVVLAIGTPAFRLYMYEPGPIVAAGTRVAVLTDEPEEALRSRAEVAVLAPPAQVCAGLADALAVANGALGLGLAGAIGLRMALPERPVVALVGDGSSMYTIQGLWTAARYGVGAVFVVMANGRYAIMDQLAARHGAPGAWPSFGEVDIAGVARGLGCPAERVTTHEELTSALDAVVPTLRSRREPLVLDVRVALESQR